MRDYAAAERYFNSYWVDGEGQIAPERRNEVMQELGRLKGAHRRAEDQHEPPRRRDPRG